MRIIVDAFGGDNAPRSVIEGSVAAAKEIDADIVLVGDEGLIQGCAFKHSIDIGSISILHADSVFDAGYEPKTVLSEHSDTSLAVGLRALTQGQGDAFVSAGSTGALVFGATFIVKRINGVRRSAIASVLPSNEKPFLLLDSGANLECRPEQLVGFATMGSIYMNKIMGVANPTVGLANIGTEPNKGTSVLTQTYELLLESKLNFTGNTEVRDIPYGDADVIVAEGFTGNVILKMYEGVAGAMMEEIRTIFRTNIKTKLSAFGLKKELLQFKSKLDYTQHGGAVLLGIAKPVIKAHGSSDPTAFKNAVRQAAECVKKDVVGEIARNIQG